MPFASFKNFADCEAKMKKRGYSEDSAKRICGALQSRYEKMKSEWEDVKWDIWLDLYKAVEKSISDDDIVKNGRPPKEWWERCVNRVKDKTNTPEKLCGWVFFHVLGGDRRRAR